MDKTQELNKLASQIKLCKNCPLYKGTTQAVPGEGSPNAEIMFIGEGPGYWEDQKGRPFVGLAGQLLDKMINSIGLKRSDVFIANVVKHRPPENRDPLPQEISACGEWLDKQIEIIDPKMIVTLGRFSMAKFAEGVSISKVHGTSRIVNFKNKKILVAFMYHPAAALRAGAVLQSLKTDFSKIPQMLEDFKNPKKILEEIKQEPEDKTKQLELI